MPMLKLRPFSRQRYSNEYFEESQMYLI